MIFNEGMIYYLSEKYRNPDKSRIVEQQQIVYQPKLKYNTKNSKKTMSSQQATKLKEEGNVAYRDKQYSRALNCYSRAIQLTPNDPNLYSNRALSYFNIGEYMNCITDCDKAIQLNPGLLKAHKKKASALAHLLKFGEAVTAMKAAVALERENQALKNELEEYEHFQSNFNRYQAAEKSNDFAEALSCIVHLCNKLPESKTLKIYKIEALAKTGDTEEATKVLNQFSGASYNPDLCYLKGIIQLYSGDSLKAKKHFAEGLQLDPDHQKCKDCLNKAKKCEKLKEEGNQLVKANRYSEAEAKYTAALELDPFNKKLNSVIYSNRALTFMKRKENLKALDDLNKSLELNPNYTKSLMRRAEVNMLREDYTNAIHDYAKIQQLDPTANLKAKIQQARKKEKLTKKKDYYAILGVSKTATDDEIKKAYKKLALKYHPDRNSTKTDAEKDEATKKFKDIAEAHGVLSDKDKRKKYDLGQSDFDGNFDGDYDEMNAGMGGMGGMPQGGRTFKMSGNMGGMGGNMGGIDPNEILKMFFGGMGGQRGGSQFFAASSGGNQNSNMDFEDFGGFGGMGGMGGFGGFGGFGNAGKQNANKKASFNFS